jgi:hypothetical protein
VLTILRDSYKLKVDACDKGSAKEVKLKNIAVNYLCVGSFCALISIDRVVCQIPLRNTHRIF